MGWGARLVAVLGMLLGVSALAGCATPIFASALHTPLFMEADHSSTIVATATSPNGIKFIQIQVTVGPAAKCSTDANVPSVLPCRQTAEVFTRYCPSQGVISETCTVVVPITANTLVTYSVYAKDRKDWRDLTEPVTYSGGRRLQDFYCWHEYQTGFVGAHSGTPEVSYSP